MSKTTVSLNTQTFFQKTWEDITKNFWYYFVLEFIAFCILLIYLGLFVNVFGVQVNFSDLVNSEQEKRFLLWWAISLSCLLTWVWVSFIHLVTEKKKSVANSIVFGLTRFFPFLILGFLIDFFGFGHFILLAVPGVIMYIYLIFSPFIYFTQNVSIISALEKSIQLSYGYFWKLFFFVVQLMALFSFFLLIPYIRIFALILLPMVAHVFFFYVYKELEKRPILHKPNMLLHSVISFIGLGTFFILLTYYFS